MDGSGACRRPRPKPARDRMSENTSLAENAKRVPESTAARVALWRALHLAVDPAPHIIVDDIGLKLLAPDAGWRGRPDMDPGFTRPFRASILARARFIED